MRKILHLEQGSEAWLSHRATPGIINASEVAAIMGIDPKTSRSELLRMKASGGEKEFSDYVQKKIIDKGHKNEALARPLAEELIGDDLSALVIADTIDGVLFSASLDGITQDYGITFEHKSLNMMFVDNLDAGFIPEENRPQMEVGLMVSGAQSCLFMASKDGDAGTARHGFYQPDMALRKRIIAACKQFAIDLENYVPTEVTIAPVAATIEALPALMIQVEGKVLATNLDQFKASAQAFIANINTNLQTDQHFADADKMVKFLKDGEERLALCKAQALAQTASIDELFRTIDTISGQMAGKRIMLGKLVAAEKTNRKTEIVTTAMKTLIAHVDTLNKRIGGEWMPPTGGMIFIEVTKGLKSLDSMRDKVSAALANAKIEASEIADRISANRLEMIGELDWSFLFPDFAAVCAKARDDFSAMLSARIAKHNEAEAARIAAAKQAEETRIAAAVEAERKAGEARAAAAVEAERAAEAKRVADAGQQASTVCEQQTDDQRGKTEPAGEAFPAIASTPPVSAREAVAAMHDANDAAMIAEYIALQACSPGEKKSMRATIEKWEAYRVKMVAARGMAVAA